MGTTESSAPTPSSYACSTQSARASSANTGWLCRGAQRRCFVHVDDAVQAILALTDHAGASGRAFNVGNPEPITILDLALRIIGRVGSRSRITMVEYEQAYDDGFEELGRRTPDITAVQNLVGWLPRRSLDEALDDVISFQREEFAVEARTQRPEELRDVRLALRTSPASAGSVEPA